jgi:hypothetical protein
MPQHEQTYHPADWGFEIGFWIAEGDPEPDIPFPSDWEVCGWPDLDPLALRRENRRRGNTTLAWPMYHVVEPMAELNAVCQFLEQMAPMALDIWLALQDRFLSISCGDTEMDATNMDTLGFFISPELIQRIRSLRLRLRVSFHPRATIRMDVDY